MLDKNDAIEQLADQVVLNIYHHSTQFPRHEIFGLTSQLRRSSISIILNYVEGYANYGPKIKARYYQIAYGSAQESKKAVEIAHKLGYIADHDFQKIYVNLDRLAALLWGKIKKLKDTINN